MRTLNFNVSGQKLSKRSSKDFFGIVRGSKQYLRAEFSFDGEWRDAVKVAEFRCTKDEISSVLVKDGACMVPNDIADASVWYVRLVGKSGETYIRTNEVRVRQED